MQKLIKKQDRILQNIRNHMHDRHNPVGMALSDHFGNFSPYMFVPRIKRHAEKKLFNIYFCSLVVLVYFEGLYNNTPKALLIKNTMFVSLFSLLA